jgi:hypothetical protein
MLIMFLWCAMTSSAETVGEAAHWNVEMASDIAAVRAANNVDARVERAISLLQTLRKRSSSDLTKANVDGIVALLDLQPDAVRLYVALCIETIGPRARAAAPKLRALLSSIRCFVERDGIKVGYEQTSEDAVRGALKSVGETPPPPKCVPPYDDAHSDDAGQPIRRRR